MFSLIRNWVKYRDVDVLALIESGDASKPLVERVGKNLKLNRSVSLCIIIYNSDISREITLEIKKGFVWNGADIPKKARWLMGNPTDKEWALCSLAHDYIIEDNIFPENHYLESKVLLEILKREKHVPTWKEYLAFMGVYLWSIYTANKTEVKK